MNQKLIKSFCWLWMLCIVSQASGRADTVRETPIVQVVKEWGSAVVNISTETVVSLKRQPFWRSYGEKYDAMYRQFYQEAYTQKVKLTSIGSGVIVDGTGLVVTNAHVVNMGRRIFVKLNDGTQVEGKIVFERKNDDLALIKIDPPFPLKVIKLASEDEMMIGETVIAIGNPYGLENSVTSGVLSGTKRNFAVTQMQHVFTDLIQTDAPINLGSSGGALLNLKGELVGINLIVVQLAKGIGFAISSGKIKTLLEEYSSVAQILDFSDKAPQKA